MAVLAVWAFIVSFAIPLGPIPWLMASKLFPVSVRGEAGSIATVVGWVGNLIVSATFLNLPNAVGTAGTVFGYAAVTVLGLVLVWFVVPETKGRALEEIQKGLVQRARRTAGA